MLPPAVSRALFALCALAALWGFVVDIKNVTLGGSIDLRNRVTGARVAADGEDPFTYKWAPGEPEEFCDVFNHAGWEMSKTTATPLVLALHAPFNGVGYGTQQWLWFLAQYGLLALGLLAWWWLAPPEVRLVGASLVLAFCATASWRLHIDRGQIYVLYAAALLGLAALGGVRKKAAAIAEGVGGALLIGLRPVLFGQFARPLARRRWDAFAGAGAGLVLAAAVPMLFFGAGIFSDYKAGMDRHAELYLEEAKPERKGIAYPETIEGIAIDDIAKSADIPFADTSVYRRLSRELPPKVALATWALLMLAAGVTMMRRAETTDRLLWWAVAAWVALGDFLVPAFRYNYNDVLFLPLLLFGLAALEGRARIAWLAVCGVWLLLQLEVWMMPKGFIPVPGLAGALIALGVVAVTWMRPRAAWLAADRPPAEEAG